MTLKALPHDFPQEYYSSKAELERAVVLAVQVKLTKCPCGRPLETEDELTAQTCERCMDDFI